MHGAIALAVAKALRQLRSLSPTSEPKSLARLQPQERHAEDRAGGTAR